MLIKIILFTIFAILYSGVAMFIFDEIYSLDDSKPDKVGRTMCYLWPLLLLFGSVLYWIRLIKKVFSKKHIKK